MRAKIKYSLLAARCRFVSMLDVQTGKLLSTASSGISSSTISSSEGTTHWKRSSTRGGKCLTLVHHSPSSPVADFSGSDSSSIFDFFRVKSFVKGNLTLFKSLNLFSNFVDDPKKNRNHNGQGVRDSTG